MSQSKYLSVCAISVALIASACSQADKTAKNETHAVPADAGASAASALPDAKAQVATAPAGELDEYPFGTVQKMAVWKRATWTPTSEKPIKVCWENPSAADAGYRASVQDAVGTTWAKVSLVSFTGWGTCGAEKDAIRIHIGDEGPHVKLLGRYLEGMHEGMVLNFTFENWSPACQQKRDYCARVIGVHEFGHALGFAHEQNRADAPFECQAEKQGTTGDWNITTYDPDSVMNYCNVRYNNDGDLSPRDVQAVTTLYGARSG